MLATTILASCTNRAERAAEYNDSVINYQKQIINAFDVMDSTIRDTTANQDQLEYAYAKLQSHVKGGILGLDSVGSFQKDPSLQLAAKQLFRSYESIIKSEYQKLVDIKLLPLSEISQAISDSCNVVQTRIYSISKVSQDKFLRTQIEFGKKYHLEFE